MKSCVSDRLRMQHLTSGSVLVGVNDSVWNYVYVIWLSTRFLVVEMSQSSRLGKIEKKEEKLFFRQCPKIKHQKRGFPRTAQSGYEAQNWFWWVSYGKRTRVVCMEMGIL